MRFSELGEVDLLPEWRKKEGSGVRRGGEREHHTSRQSRQSGPRWLIEEREGKNDSNRMLLTLGLGTVDVTLKNNGQRS